MPLSRLTYVEVALNCAAVSDEEAAFANVVARKPFTKCPATAV
jgi:hypothetical protein